MIELVTPAAVPPISTANAKVHLRIDTSEEDTLIERMVLAAEEIICARTERAMTNTTFCEHLRAFPANAIEPIRPLYGPLSSVTSLKYYDENDDLQTWDSAEYEVLCPRNVRGAVSVKPGYAWPTYRTDRPWPVQLTYVAGYGAAATAIPYALLEAMYLVLDDLFRYRGASVCMPMSQPVAAALDRIANMHDWGSYP